MDTFTGSSVSERYSIQILILNCQRSNDNGLDKSFWSTKLIASYSSTHLLILYPMGCEMRTITSTIGYPFTECKVFSCILHESFRTDCIRLSHINMSYSSPPSYTPTIITVHVTVYISTRTVTQQYGIDTRCG